MENTKRSISLYVDKDLARIIKNKHNRSNINKELELLLQNDGPVDKSTEIAFDSLPETKTIIHTLNKLNNKVNKLYESVRSLEAKTMDISLELVCDYKYTNNNACDCMSEYFEAFEDSKQQIQKRQRQENLDNLIAKNFLTKQVKQIIQFHEIDEKTLNLYNNNKQIIEFLLDHIKSNKEIIQLLTYKKIYNKNKRPYKTNTIATKRYRYKKNKTSRNDR